MEKTINLLEESALITLFQFTEILNNPEIKSLSEELRKCLSETKDAKLKSKLLACSINASTKIEEIKDSIKHHSSQLNLIQPSTRKPVRIYIDGVFDIIHSGHFNAIRQAKKLGDILVVGVNSDEDVTLVKGPPIMNGKERAALARACKWADVVEEDTPYTPTLAFMDKIGVDFCSHGDDIPYNEKGECVYDEMIKVGRMKIFKRTEGVSTTEIIGRWLSCSTERKISNEGGAMKTSTDLVNDLAQLEDFKKNKKPVMSSFLATSWRIAEFCNNRVPKEGDKIIYIDGAFDILHIGHVETLRKAKEMGDFLYVGVHEDDIVNKYRGKNYPILNLNERVFNLLALRYVDEVVIAAPWKITEDMVKSWKINLVVQGTSLKYDESYLKVENPESDPYEIPKKLGIYKTIESEFDLTNEILVERLLKNRSVYIKKYLNKAQKDQDVFDEGTNKEVKEI